MELKRHFDTKFLLIGVYILAFLIYIIVGLSPAKATYHVDGSLSIPSISLGSDVTTLTLNDNTFDVPDTIVGSFSNHHNKTLLMGHSTTVFS